MSAIESVDYASLLTSGSPQTLLRSLGKSGVAFVRGGVPAQFGRDAQAAATRLFGLSDKVKSELVSSTAMEPGFGPYGQARAMDTGIPNLLESWTISPHSPVNVPAEQREDWYVLVAFARQLRALAENLVVAIDLAWDARGTFVDAICRDMFPLHLLHYPAGLLGTDPGARRQSVHVDSSLITLLPPALGKGLAYAQDGRLVPLDVPAGSVAVIAGSLLEFLTSARIPACRHTVETPAGAAAEDRISFTYFVNARPNMTLRPVQPGGEFGEEGRQLDTSSHLQHYMEKVYSEPRSPE